MSRWLVSGGIIGAETRLEVESVDGVDELTWRRQGWRLELWQEWIFSGREKSG